MNKKLILIVSLLAAPMLANAQDDAPDVYSYVTYYYCDVATQGNMDSVVEAYEKPVFDQWVEDGKLMSWGYFSHFTGGRWRRLQYHVSDSMEGALNAQASIFSEIYSDNREGGQARGQACEAHDDYVWVSTLGSPADSDSGNVSLSVYYVCDIADEQRADEIFEEIYAPRLEAARESGDLASWGWMSHRIGGKYRRLQTMLGADHGSVNAARLQIVREANQEDGALAREFAGICHSHTDYLWDIIHETP